MVNDRLGHIDGNGKADTDIAAALAKNGRVNTHDLAPEVQERTARVAGINRGIRLDKIVIRSGTDNPPFGADDASRYCLFETERVADGP